MYCSRSASSRVRRDRVRQIGEQRRHLGRRLQIALGVAAPAAARRARASVWWRMQVRTSKSGRVGRRREADAVGRERSARGTPPPDRRSASLSRLLVAPEMPLQLDVDAASRPNTPTRRSSRPPTPCRRPSSAARPASATRPRGVAVELVERQRALAFRRAQLHARDQPAEIPVALRDFAEDGQEKGWTGWTSWKAETAVARLRVRPSDVCRPAPAIVSSAPMIGWMPGGTRGLVKARRAVDAVAIEQRERRIAELGGALDERFGQRRALQKAEGRGGVELDVHDGTERHGIDDSVVQSTIASMNHRSVSRSRNTR